MHPMQIAGDLHIVARLYAGRRGSARCDVVMVTENTVLVILYTIVHFYINWIRLKFLFDYYVLYAICFKMGHKSRKFNGLI